MRPNTNPTGKFSISHLQIRFPTITLPLPDFRFSQHGLWIVLSSGIHYNAMLSGEIEPKFRRKILLSSSWSKFQSSKKPAWSRQERELRNAGLFSPDYTAVISKRYKSSTLSLAQSYTLCHIMSPWYSSSLVAAEFHISPSHSTSRDV
jgi:hypothetical protein